MGTILVSPSVANALVHFIETVQSRGRDMKLVTAVFETLTAFISETPAEVFAERLQTNSTVGDSEARSDPSSQKRRANKKRRRSTVLSKQQNERLLAVIDSLSDDEAARYLGIGVRQVRRRASAGKLYTFVVGGKKWYSLWQFADRYHVLPGLHETIRAIPLDWPPERVQQFMTDRHGLKLSRKCVSPVTWLSRGGDPESVTKLLAANAAD